MAITSSPVESGGSDVSGAVKPVQILVLTLKELSKVLILDWGYSTAPWITAVKFRLNLEWVDCHMIFITML